MKQKLNSSIGGVACKSSFKPFVGKVEIEPIKPESFLEVDTPITVGRVIAVGDYVTDFKKGDVILFRSFGCDEVEYEGVKHYVVEIASEFVLGKYGKK